MLRNILLIIFIDVKIKFKQHFNSTLGKDYTLQNEATTMTTFLEKHDQFDKVKKVSYIKQYVKRLYVIYMITRSLQNMLLRWNFTE